MVYVSASSAAYSRIAALFVATTLFVSPAAAFVIGKHQTITENALKRVILSTWEQEKLIKGSSDADLVEGGLVPGTPYDPAYHFDNYETEPSIRQEFVDLAGMARQNISRPIRDPWAFGKILHSIQDFYSHSNYVPLYRAYRKSRGASVDSIPTIEEVILEPARYPGFEQWLGKVRTGYYPNKNTYPDAETDHGYPVGPGLHKDSFQRDFHIEAMETAERASVWYLNLYLKDPVTWKQCRKVWGVGL